MLTDEQLSQINGLVLNGSSLRDAIRAASGLELNEKLRDWLLAHPTMQSDYLRAKHGKTDDQSA
jgi:hypothetical protein